MKLGYCTSFTDDLFLAQHQLGADYVECGLSQIAACPEDVFQDRIKAMEKAAISCKAANVLFPGELSLTGPSVQEEEIACYLDKAFRRAQRLGVKTVVFGSGGARRIPEDFPRDKAWQQLLHLCRDILGPAAKTYGITCCIEPLNRKECNILNTCAESFRLVQEANHPNVQLLMDLYHFDVEQEPLSSLTRYGSHLQHLHIASAKNNRAQPREGDGEDYPALFSALQQLHYQGKLSIEANLVGDPAKAIAESLAFLRTFLF